MTETKTVLKSYRRAYKVHLTLISLKRLLLLLQRSEPSGIILYTIDAILVYLRRSVQL